MPGPGSSGAESLVSLVVSLLPFGLLGITAVLALLVLALRWSGNREARRAAALEAKWEPRILGALAGGLELRGTVELVRPGEEYRFLDCLLRFSARLSEEGGGRLKALAEPYLDQVADAARKAGTHERARAVRILGAFGMPEYGHAIRRALDDPAPEVSMLAARALAAPELRTSPEILLRRFHRFHSWRPSYLAGLLAGTGASGWPVLRNTLRDEACPGWLRAVLAQALRMARDIDSADLAAVVLGKGGHADLLVACLRLLEEFGHDRHRDALTPFFRCPDFAVRAHSLKALRTVGDTRDLAVFTGALDDESPWVVLEAARGLRALGALEPLQELADAGGARASLAREVLWS